MLYAVEFSFYSVQIRLAHLLEIGVPSSSTSHLSVSTQSRQYIKGCAAGNAL